jgi:cytidylate kinase
VVFPDAAVKIFLEADARVRAERRARETGQELDVVLGEQIQRDHQDSSRPDSPLIIPEGATIVDTSSLDIDQVVDRVVGLVEAASF